MKLALVLGTCLISSLFSAAAFAQGPPHGTVTISAIIIEGTYYAGMYVDQDETASSDEALAGITANYVAAPGSSVAPDGYVIGFPKIKYKYYGADESLLGSPGLLDATPISFGNGGMGSSTAVSEAFCMSLGTLFTAENISVLNHDRTIIRLPSPAKTLIRQWKLIGSAGSQNAQSSDSKSALAPTFSTSVDGSIFT